MEINFIKIKYLLKFINVFIVLIAILACSDSKKNNQEQPVEVKMTKRFFSDASFWNQPIPPNAKVDSRSDNWIKLLEQEPTVDHFDFNNELWTIPVYEVDSLTPTYNIKRIRLDQNEKDYRLSEKDFYGFGEGFGTAVPIPNDASPDPEEDAHIAIIDRDRNLAWDMWGLNKLEDGTWESFTGMKYALNGDGIFKTEKYASILDGESVHFHGPSRAAGVPTIAGLIMYDEIIAGEINHKLSCASRFAAFQEFVFPASWTDGTFDGGIPEGAVIQLDPNLDLSQFDLLPGEIIVAKALQKYGMVLVDVAFGQSIYAEGLWARPKANWKGLLRPQEEGLKAIKFKHYRVLQVTKTVKGKGDASKDRVGESLKVDWNPIQ